MSKHKIEVEGLPKGWEPVAHRIPQSGENYFEWGEIVYCIKSMPTPRLIVKKKQPRRITFEETDCAGISDLDFSCGVQWTFFDDKYWREVKETEETKLCLSVEECKQLTGGCRVLEAEVYKKIIKFINNNKTS